MGAAKGGRAARVGPREEARSCGHERFVFNSGNYDLYGHTRRGIMLKKSQKSGRTGGTSTANAVGGAGGGCAKLGGSRGGDEVKFVGAETHEKRVDQFSILE